MCQDVSTLKLRSLPTFFCKLSDDPIDPRQRSGVPLRRPQGGASLPPPTGGPPPRGPPHALGPRLTPPPGPGVSLPMALCEERLWDAGPHPLQVPFPFSSWMGGGGRWSIRTRARTFPVALPAGVGPRTVFRSPKTPSPQPRRTIVVIGAITFQETAVMPTRQVSYIAPKVWGNIPDGAEPQSVHTLPTFQQLSRHPIFKGSLGSMIGH